MIWLLLYFLAAAYGGGCVAAAIMVDRPAEIERRIRLRTAIGMKRRAAARAVYRSIVILILFWPIHIRKSGRLI